MERTLTTEQEIVLAKLRKADCPWVAAVAEEHWKRGERYYIDSRVNISASLRTWFERANKKAGNV